MAPEHQLIAGICEEIAALLQILDEVGNEPFNQQDCDYLRKRGLGHIAPQDVTLEVAEEISQRLLNLLR